jgi:lysophospholipase L1-like esterase
MSCAFRVSVVRLLEMKRNLILYAVSWVGCFNIIHAAPAPFAETMTVVAFGDSTTARRGATKVYATILQEELQNVRVINAGVGGNTTEMARNRFEIDVLRNQPQIAIIQFGINDAAVDVWKTPPATTPRVSLERYEEHLRFFAQTLKAYRTRVVMMTPTPIRWTAKLREMYGKPPYRPEVEDGFNTLMTPYCEAVRRIAREESVEFLDMQQGFVEGARKLGVTVDALLADGMHPNDKGHRIEADLLLGHVFALKNPPENANAHHRKSFDQPFISLSLYTGSALERLDLANFWFDLGPARVTRRNVASRRIVRLTPSYAI